MTLPTNCLGMFDHFVILALKGLKLTLEEHLQDVFKKVHLTTSLFRKLQNVLSGITLVTIYKAFVRAHLDYGNILYHHAILNNSFHDRLGTI